MTIHVQCACGQVLAAADEHAGRQGKCSQCGRLLTIPQRTATTAEAAARTQYAQAKPETETHRTGAGTTALRPPPPDWQTGCGAADVPPPADWQMGYGAAQIPPVLGDEVYDPNCHLDALPAHHRAIWTLWRPAPFSVAGAVLLNIVTGGLFGLIYYGIKLGELPKVSVRDFGTGHAIGFMFIPFYNFYWMFRFWHALADRLNLQLRLRHLDGYGTSVARSLATAVGVLAIVAMAPYAGWCLVSVAAFICHIVLVSQVQRAINMVAKSVPYSGCGHAAPKW